MSIPRISAKFETTLSLKVSVGETTGTLTSVEDSDGVSLPNGLYGFTVDEGNSDFEYFEATITDTALSGVVSFSSTALTETVGFTKAHRAGSEIKITDFTILGHLTGIFRGSEQMDGASPLEYDSTPTLSSSNQLATVQYVLDNITGGSVSFDSNVLAGVAGETIASGEWVYFKESDGRWYLTDANEKTQSVSVKIGMAKGAGTSGSAISGGVFCGGIEKTGTYVAGTKYYLSNTAGDTGTTAGEEEVLVGIGDDNGDLIFVSVYDPEAVTADEKDAIEGTIGTPSTNNKFVTEDNVSIAGNDQSQTTDDTTISVGESDSTTKKVKIAQSFSPQKTKIRGVALKMAATTGTFTGTIEVSIQADDGSGNPDGTDLVTVTDSHVQYSTVNDHEFEFATEYSSLDTESVDPYWIVVETSTTDDSNHPNLRSNSAGGYSSGELKYWNTTDGWTIISGNDLYFKTLEGVSSQIVKTDSSGEIPNEFYSLSKMPALSCWQNVPITADSGSFLMYGSASNEDGSIVWVRTNYTNGELTRLDRDEKTGAYYATARQTSVTNLNPTMVILGDYIYGFRDNGASVGGERYDLADGANQTTLSLPTIPSGSSGAIHSWTDGEFIYIHQVSQTTVYKCSVSGTTLTQEDTGVMGALTTIEGVQFLWDGKKIWAVDERGGSLNVYEFNDPFFNSSTQVTIRSGVSVRYAEGDDDMSDNITFAANIDEQRFYSGRITYNERSATEISTIVMVPYSKS